MTKDEKKELLERVSTNLLKELAITGMPGAVLWVSDALVKVVAHEMADAPTDDGTPPGMEQHGFYVTSGPLTGALVAEPGDNTKPLYRWRHAAEVIDQLMDYQYCGEESTET
jgi:hypothetical protein